MATDAPKIKLHWLEGSRAQSILWLLEELQAPYELDVYHRQPSMAAPPELERVHPLGKAPVVTVTPAAGQGEPLTLAESGFIVQYLCDHFAAPGTLAPRRWREGAVEGAVGAETDEWLRFQYYLYYAEGSLMPYMWMHMIMSVIQGPSVPFFLRPITGAVASRVHAALVLPNWRRHAAFLEGQLRTAPGGGGGYLAGPRLTAADILMSFPLLASRAELAAALGADNYPGLFAYIDRLRAEPGYQRAVQKIKDIEGHFSVKPQPPK